MKGAPLPPLKQTHTPAQTPALNPPAQTLPLSLEVTDHALVGEAGRASFALGVVIITPIRCCRDLQATGRGHYRTGQKDKTDQQQNPQFPKRVRRHSNNYSSFDHQSEELLTDSLLCPLSLSQRGYEGRCLLTLQTPLSQYPVSHNSCLLVVPTLHELPRTGNCKPGSQHHSCRGTWAYCEHSFPGQIP